LSNALGSYNSAFGVSALQTNTTGNRNSAFGHYALQSNTTCRQNSAFGQNALQFNETGIHNAAFGFRALRDSTGNENSAFGRYSLRFNTAGADNSGFGKGALAGNTTGDENTAVVSLALNDAVTASQNVALGFSALSNATGGNNIAIGHEAGINQTSGSDNVYLGNAGSAAENDTIRVGNSAQTRLFLPTTLASVTGTTLVINGSGQVGPTTSSARFKRDIESLGAEEASALLEKLRPVTYRYRDQPGSPADPAFQYGLIAEEVAEVAPALVIYDEDGRPYSVQYQALGPMLIGAMQRQQDTIGAHETTIETHERTTEAHERTIETLLARVERLEQPTVAASRRVNR
jgi:hypothetical protein